MNIITVKINGVEYNLKGEEQEDYLHKVARYVDKKIADILENNPKLSTSSASILTAINAIDEGLKKEEQIENLQLEIDKLKKVQHHQNLKVEEIRILLAEEKEKNKDLEAQDVDDSAKEYKEKLEKLQVQMGLMEKTAKKYMEENNKIKIQNKELKFQLQSSKYKVLDLEKKLMDSQLNLVKEKKKLNPLQVKDMKK
ncbi:cell division protein ZapA [Clostridium botulinum]|uniref:Cell division protein ZapA n=1 Tax=Clostridium botulinum TaxID=1491 RepID=A0A6B4U9J0_CLOBO|nr:cell division protein ZapA [Clostridium botulinum]KRU25533.1 cell division protein ZapA [Clostridium sporogenes]KRU27285.1 cell division protein ZapA [Clostridium sporogenes]KRU30207.1 cell division protein ZapA [Clostridium sporogenes]KRU38391.1 cell division protein ZapA [Clostridium sporogenes]MBZ1328932.1 cell division protein ZapA [Clostridium botulinum]